MSFQKKRKKSRFSKFETNLKYVFSNTGHELELSLRISLCVTDSQRITLWRTINWLSLSDVSLIRTKAKCGFWNLIKLILRTFISQDVNLLVRFFYHICTPVTQIQHCNLVAPYSSWYWCHIECVQLQHRFTVSVCEVIINIHTANDCLAWNYKALNLDVLLPIYCGVTK